MNILIVGELLTDFYAIYVKVIILPSLITMQSFGVWTCFKQQY